MPQHSPSNLPYRTKVAVVGHDNRVNEIIYREPGREIIRDCKFMNFGPGVEPVEVGWYFLNYRWVSPEDYATQQKEEPI